MTLFILQITLITTIAVAAGVALGWWANIYYKKEQENTLKKELQLLKSYFSESLKENSKVKLQLKLAEEKIDVLGTNNATVIWQFVTRQTSRQTYLKSTPAAV